MEWQADVVLERAAGLIGMVPGRLVASDGAGVSGDTRLRRVRPLPPHGPFDDRTLYVAHEAPEVGPFLLLLTDADATATVSAVADALDALNEWDARLLEAMAQRRTVAEVLAIGAEQLANPIALFDASTALVSYAGELPAGYEDTIWGAVVSRGYAPLSYYAPDERERIGRELLASREPHVSHPRRERGRAHVTVMAHVDGRPYAMLSQVELVRPFTAGELQILSHLRDRIEQLGDASVGAQRHASPMEHCVRMLLEGNRVERSAVRYHLTQRGWRADDRFVLVRCSAAHELNEVDLQSLRARFATVASGALVLSYQESVVLIVHDAWTQSDEEALLRVAAEYGLRLGVSSPFVGLMPVRTAYAQASVALDLADGRELVGRYDELFALRVTRLLGEGAGVEELCHPSLLALAESDGDDVRESLRTLYVYLLCGCNVAKAAKRLYLHRNTLEYRLRRLGERVGIDVEGLDETEQLRVMLSCLLLGMRGSSGARWGRNPA